MFTQDELQKQRWINAVRNGESWAVNEARHAFVRMIELAPNEQLQNVFSELPLQIQLNVLQNAEM